LLQYERGGCYRRQAAQRPDRSDKTDVPPGAFTLRKLRDGRGNRILKSPIFLGSVLNYQKEKLMAGLIDDVRIYTVAQNAGKIEAFAR